MSEMAIARIGGQTVEAPADLYIPPDALKVLLQQFEGPLDLLLWLIRRNRFDIRDLPIAEIARQYDRYIELMRTLDIELVSEYLFMAAWLAEIKSRMLLPRPDLGELEQEEEEDPRTALMQRLLAYEGYRQAAQWLEQRCRQATEEIWPVQLWDDAFVADRPSLEMEALFQALGEILLRQDWQQAHEVVQAPIELEDKLAEVLARLDRPDRHVAFEQLLRPQEGRMGVAVTFLALLELLRQGVIELHQPELFAPIELKRVA